MVDIVTEIGTKISCCDPLQSEKWECSIGYTHRNSYVNIIYRLHNYASSWTIPYEMCVCKCLKHMNYAPEKAPLPRPTLYNLLQLSMFWMFVEKERVRGERGRKLEKKKERGRRKSERRRQRGTEEVCQWCWMLFRMEKVMHKSSSLLNL